MARSPLLAWYITRRVPSVPRWLVWGWTMTVPWTLHFSTHITNPSYVLAGAVVFFIGFFEVLPPMRLGLVPLPAAFAAMGMGVDVGHADPHVVVPDAALSGHRVAEPPGRRRGEDDDLRAGVRRRRRGTRPCALPDGCCSTARLGGTGGTLRNLHVHFVSPAEILVTLARVFSFASLEINRFVEIDDARRILFVRNHLWLVPLMAIVWAAGIVQPFWMLAS